MAHTEDDRKEADAGALFGGREEVSRHLLRGEFGTRFLPDEAAGAEAVDGEFSFAEQQQVRAMKSAVGAAVVDARDDSSSLVAQYKGAPQLAAGLVAADDADWMARPTHGGPFSKRAPTSAAEDLVDRAAFGADVIMPPMLPSPPYPLEVHSYSMSGVKSLHAKRYVHAALVSGLVDADFIEPESRWECVKVVMGTRTAFHIRMYRATACLALEFQRRNGCSITYNRAVSELRSHIAESMGCDQLERFERSGADAVAVPSVGFAISTFDDIPDVPLGLGLDLGEEFDGGDLLSESPVPEEAAGVAALLAMVDSWSTSTQAEGIAAIASLSATGEGRDMLVAAEGVPTSIIKALCSDSVAVSGAGATALANLSESEEMQARLVAAGCVLPALRAAKQRHTSRDAHVRRECLRALANLTATQSESITAAGGAEAVARVFAECDDARMRKHASRAVDLLRA